MKNFKKALLNFIDFKMWNAFSKLGIFLTGVYVIAMIECGIDLTLASGALLGILFTFLPAIFKVNCEE